MLASMQSNYESLGFQTTENEAAAEVVSAFVAEVEVVSQQFDLQFGRQQKSLGLYLSMILLCRYSLRVLIRNQMKSAVE